MPAADAPTPNPDDKVLKVVWIPVNAGAEADAHTFLGTMKRIKLAADGVDMPAAAAEEPPPPAPTAGGEPMVSEFEIKGLQYRLTKKWEGMPAEQLNTANAIWCFVSFAAMLGDAEEWTLHAFSKILAAHPKASIALILTSQAQTEPSGRQNRPSAAACKSKLVALDNVEGRSIFSHVAAVDDQSSVKFIFNAMVAAILEENLKIAASMI